MMSYPILAGRFVRFLPDAAKRPGARVGDQLAQIVVVVLQGLLAFQPLAKADIMKSIGRGSDSLNSTVYLSRALISLTALNRTLRGMRTPAGGLAIRSKVAFTSSAVSWAPSLNSTSLRRKKV